MSYEPEVFSGGTQEELLSWLTKELLKVRAAMGLKLDQQVKFLSAPPDRIREGLIVGADGTAWDPGSGKGLYVYRDAAWQKLD